jgi:Bacterial membrane protein YfhO
VAVVARVGAALRRHEHRTAAAVFALFVLAYLWPALVGGDVLSPGAVLWGTPPWRASLPPEGIAYYNGLLSDVPMSYYPWDALARSMIHSGTFPAWNPHAFAGTPFFANMSVAWLGPFSLPLWILPLNYALGVSAALKLWVAAFGTYLFVRELRLGFWPGLLAGFSFALCAFDVVWLTHQAHVAVAVLLPWLLWLAERIVRRGGRWEGIALAGVVAAALAGGHPGTQVHVLGATLLYALVRCALLPEVSGGERLRRLATVAAGMLLGVVLMAAVLLPGERAAVDTIGEQVRRQHNTGSTGMLPLQTLLAAVFPDWWGRPSEALIEGPLNYNERAFYGGTVALLFAVVGLLSPGGWRRKAPLLPLLALGLAVPMNVPAIRWVVVHLPAFDRVENRRMMLWFAFAVAVLAAFGLQAVLDAPRRQARAWLAVGAAFAGAAVAIGSIAPAPGDVGLALDHLTDRFAGATPGALALASVVRWLALAAAVAAVLVVLRLRPRRPWLAGGAIALLAAADMLLFAHAFQPMGPRALVMPPRTPAVAFLQRTAAEGRIAGVAGALPSDWSTTYGLRDARGYDAPQPSRRFYALWRAVNPTQVEYAPFDVAGLSPAALRVLSLLGTRYVIVAPDAAPPADSGLRSAYRGADAQVLENSRATPRAFVAEQVIAAADDQEELAIVLTNGFDPRRDAIVRRDEIGGDRPAGVASASVHVVEDANSHVSLRASLPKRGLVVLDDAWAPGWEATVDGRPARVVETNMVLRGVVVPAGEHTIAWRYHVPGLRSGALLSGAGLLGLLAWAGLLLRTRRRSAPAR